MEPLPEYRAVIFDMDGLMLDTERLVSDLWAEMALASSLEMPKDVIYELIGRTVKDGGVIVGERLGLDFPYEDLHDRVNARLAELFVANQVPKKLGLVELLDWLESRGIPRMVATSTVREEAIARLTSTELLTRFAGLVGGDEVAQGKPAPDLFLRAASLLDVEPSQCVVLEDSEAGIRAACAAGMHSMMIPDLKPPSAEIQQMARHVFPSLIEATETLKQMAFRA